jgi:hypothetical protein
MFAKFCLKENLHQYRACFGMYATLSIPLDQGGQTGQDSSHDSHSFEKETYSSWQRITNVRKESLPQTF